MNIASSYICHKYSSLGHYFPVLTLNTSITFSPKIFLQSTAPNGCIYRYMSLYLIFRSVSVTFSVYHTTITLYSMVPLIFALTTISHILQLLKDCSHYWVSCKHVHAPQMKLVRNIERMLYWVWGIRARLFLLLIVLHPGVPKKEWYVE